MAAFDRGDRVVATKDLGGGLFTAVPKGTRGEVIRVDESWTGSVTFTVRFENDKIEEVKENGLYRDR